MARVRGAAITAVSVGLSMVIARHFFKSYSFSGPGYLPGLPVGFASLGASSLFKMTSLLYSADLVLHPAFFWVQMSLYEEAFALSYYYKNSDDSSSSKPIGSRDVLSTTLPFVMVAVLFMVPTAVLISGPYSN